MGVAVASLSVYIWWALIQQEQAQIEWTTQLQAASVKNELTAQMDARLQALHRMAKHWEVSGQPSQTLWGADAELSLAHFPGYQAIAWVDPTFQIRWHVSRPGQEEGSPLSLRFEGSRRLAMEAARNQRAVRLSETFELAEGGKGFLACVPLVMRDRFRGWVLGVFDIQVLLGAIFHDQVARWYSIAVFEGKGELYRRDPASDEDGTAWDQETGFSLGGLTWRVRVWPQPEELAESRSFVPYASLLVGLLVAVLLALMVHLAHMARFRARTVEATNRELAREIVERKRLEGELRLAKDTAEQASRAKSDFLASMSHELRTPLNAIIGFSEVLKEEGFGPLNEKQREYVNDVWTSGKHLLSLINDILDLSKVEAGKMELEPSDVDLNVVLRHSVVMIKEKALKHRLRVSLDIAEDLGVITADERKVKQILFNLLSNAAKFTSDGGTIGIRAKRHREHEVLVSVWDTGIGIDPGDRGKIFQEFVRLDNSYARKYPGTGLGLALTKKFVELHGGQIWFESDGKGQGTRFHFTLPVRGPGGLKAPAPTSPQRAVGS